MHKLRILLIPSLILIALLGLSSCGPGAGEVPEGKVSAASLGALPSTTIRLRKSSASVEGLVQEVLGALAAGDTTALLNVLVTGDEFQRYLYPELGIHYPAARDTSAQARQFVWENQSMGTAKALRKVMGELGGRRMQLLAVTFRDGGKKFNSYTIHEGTEVKVRLEDGSESDLLALGSIVEMDGVYKLLSYRDRD